MLISQKWKEIEVGGKEESDKITVEIKPMAVGAYHRALSFILKGGSDFDDEGKRGAVIEKMMGDTDVIDIIKEVIPLHARKLKGVQLQEDNGNIRDATIEELCDSGAGLNICLTILVSLISASQLTEGESKNSERPSL